MNNIDAIVRDLRISANVIGIQLQTIKELEARIAALEGVDRHPAGAVVSAYRIGDDINAIRVERVQQMEGPDLWAVRRHAEVLNRQGSWEWEPLPSNRDDDFLARCRFSTSESAVAAALVCR